MALGVALALSTSANAWAQGKKRPKMLRPKPTPRDGDAKADDAKEGDAKAGDAKEGDAKEGDAKEGDAKAGGDDAAKTDSGDAKTADGGDGADTPAVDPDAPMDGATYVVRLRDLEARIDELKEQIRRSHTRLSLLSDTILSGATGGARAEVKFVNDMSNAFRLNRALFVLDGAVQYNRKDDAGGLAAQKEIPIFTGSIAPGDHTLQVLVGLRGHGYGVFSYLKGYKFEVKSSHSFTVTEGKTIEVEAIAWDEGRRHDAP